MPAKQGLGGNRIKTVKLCIFALFTGACIVLGYIESLLPLTFIAPGVKIGLSNSVALILATKREYKGAVLVNIARILLSALLFGSLVSAVFSLAGGLVSITAVILLSKTEKFSVVGQSVAGGVLHNMAQCVIASLITGMGVVCYLPILILSGAVSGTVVGVISLLISKKVKTNREI